MKQQQQEETTKTKTCFAKKQVINISHFVKYVVLKMFPDQEIKEIKVKVTKTNKMSKS